MKKRDFFINALKNNNFINKKWLHSAFSVNINNEEPDDFIYNIAYKRTDGGIVVEFLLPDEPDKNGDAAIVPNTTLDDWDFDQEKMLAPFHPAEEITITKEDIPNLKEGSITTSYGTLLMNYLLLVYPFGDKIEYISGKLNIKDIEAIIEKRLTSGNSVDNPNDKKNLYVDEYLKYKKATMLCDSLTQISVPSATRKSVQGHPDAEKVKAELLEKYKDQLNDPAVIAKIQEELKKLDLEWLEGDESLGFYTDDKHLDVVRMQAYYMVGRKDSFSESVEPSLITESLNEGIGPEHTVALNNSIREGSFDRGSQTMLGGVLYKLILRIMQNSNITEDDCGSKVGLDVKITGATKNQYIGLYALESGKPVEITEDNISSYLNKDVTIRTPAYCKTAKDDFCKICIGERYAKTPTGIASAAANVGSILMNVFMKSMHAKALKTVEYDITKELH